MTIADILPLIPGRPELRAPWRSDGVAYATDGAVLVRGPLAEPSAARAAERGPSNAADLMGDPADYEAEPSPVPEPLVIAIEGDDRGPWDAARWGMAWLPRRVPVGVAAIAGVYAGLVAEFGGTLHARRDRDPRRPVRAEFPDGSEAAIMPLEPRVEGGAA